MHKNLRDSYKYYKKDSLNPVDIKMYLDIVHGHMKFMIEKVVDGEEITLPARFGNLSITGKKQVIRYDEEGNVQGLAPDWVKTKELWDRNPVSKENKQLVYCTNEHTSGIRYRFFWSKLRVLVTNKTLYALKMTRTNKREVSNRVKNGKEYQRT